MIWATPVLISHNWAFGSPFRTPYVNHLGVGGEGGSDQQLGAYSLGRIPSAATGMFVGPRLKGYPDADQAWLTGMFWILAAIPGACVVLSQKKNRVFWTTLITTTIAAFIFYLSFRASTPYSLKYGVLHYFKMFWPGLVILSAVFFNKLIDSQTGVENKGAIRKKSPR